MMLAIGQAEIYRQYNHVKAVTVTISKLTEYKKRGIQTYLIHRH